jgi:hypothetical protein
MIILMVCAVFLMVGLALIFWGGLDWEVHGMIANLVGGVGLAFCVTTIPLERMGWKSTFLEIEAIRETRGTDTAGIEDAAWRMKAAEVNAKLASGRYYNSTMFDLWIPDQVDDVEPLK